MWSFQQTVRSGHDGTIIFEWHENFTESFEVKDCEHCVRENMSLLSLKKISLKSSKPGEEMYADLFRPLPLTSIGVARYFCTFFENYSQFRSAFMLQKKPELQNTFSYFFSIFERKYACNLKLYTEKAGGELRYT